MNQPAGTWTIDFAIRFVSIDSLVTQFYTSFGAFLPDNRKMFFDHFAFVF